MLLWCSRASQTVSGGLRALHQCSGSPFGRRSSTLPLLHVLQRGALGTRRWDKTKLYTKKHFEKGLAHPKQFPNRSFYSYRSANHCAPKKQNDAQGGGKWKATNTSHEAEGRRSIAGVNTRRRAGTPLMGGQGPDGPFTPAVKCAKVRRPRGLLKSVIAKQSPITLLDIFERYVERI